MSHSKFSPSAAHIWGRPDGCPGYINASSQFPDTTNDAAEWGTAAHDVGAHLIQRYYTALDLATFEGVEPEFNPEFMGRTENDLVVDSEMLDVAHFYAMDVIAAIRAEDCSFSIEIEERVDCPRIHPESFGTPDCVVYFHETKRLHLWDLKTGRSVVEVYKNLQLANYAAGVFDKFLEAEEIILHIVQPRAFHVSGAARQWAAPVGTFEKIWQQLSDAAHAAALPDAPVRSGSHCRYCEARHACPAALNSAMAAVDYIEAPELHGDDPDAIAFELRTLRRAEEAIKFRLSGVEAQATELIKSGRQVPGFRVEDTRGRKTWKDDPAKVIEIGRLCGVNLAKPAQPITPTEAAKILAPEIVNSLSHSPIKGVKLVADDGKKAAAVFNTNT